MKIKGRTQNTIRNMTVMFAMQALTVLTSFVSRTFFVRLLAAEYLGLSGLFTNIISVLAISELGIGNVIIIHLYKPLAEQDEQRICSLMDFYRKAYTVIGIFIIVCGILLMPFLDYLVKSDSNIPHLEMYFLLFILQSATSYFFVYKQSLLTASQQEYICSFIQQVFGIITKILQILFLMWTRQYAVYLLVSIATNIATNITISRIADKKFPQLKRGKQFALSKKETTGMFKNVGSMMIHKVGHTVINSTDNILISSMVGVIYTGLYSNYLLIVNSVNQVVNIAFSAVSASVGDYNARQTQTQQKQLFDAMQMIAYWLFGMSAICFCCLFQPTIEVWLGKDFLLDYPTVLLVCINFYVNGIIRVPSTFTDVNGLYTKTKIKPLLMTVINLTFSIVCLHFWGLAGVFAGTLISYLSVAIWVDPYVIYKNVFGVPLRGYFWSLLRNTLLVALVGVITWIAVYYTPIYILKVLVCVLMSNGLLLLSYWKTEAFAFVFLRIKGVFARKRS